MQQINGREAAFAVLNDPAFVVPPVPPASTGVAWLRATVGRFSAGEAHERRRALTIAILDAIALESLRSYGPMHPVAVLARKMGIGEPVVDLVRDVAQAYQPGTGDESRAAAAVARLVAVLGGVFDEPNAARIGVLVQAYQPTMALIERTRDRRPVDDVLRDDPPVPATKRQALVRTTVGDITVEAGEVVRVRLAGDLAFGSGPRRCPGREHALALVEGALA